MKTVKILQVGNNPASNKYIANKKKKLLANGIQVDHVQLPETISYIDFREIVNVVRLSPNSKRGVIIQQPVPFTKEQVDELNNMLNPSDDLDGLGYHNLGLLMQGNNEVAPCTPLGIYNTLKEKYGETLKNKRITIAGRSLLVGKPLVIMLINEGCSVSIFGSNETEPFRYLSNCDIFISAIGKPHYWTGNKFRSIRLEYIIDVGFTIDGETIKGDVSPDIAGRGEITPVPGGVGQWTTDTIVSKVLGETFIKGENNENSNGR